MKIYGITVRDVADMSDADLRTLCNFESKRAGVSAETMYDALKVGIRAEVWEKDCAISERAVRKFSLRSYQQEAIDQLSVAR